MKTDWQTIVAVAIAVLAAIWAGYMLIVPMIAAMRPAKPGKCAGGCGCGHEDKNSAPESGKADACGTPGPNYQKLNS
jgi:hypothetical protein